MRRAGAIMALTILIVMLLSTSLCFAGNLELVDSYPEEGSHYSVLQNVMVKLKFSENMVSPNAQAANIDCFEIKSATGKTLPFQILYDTEKAGRSNDIWLLVGGTLESDTVYTITMNANLQSSSGNMLGADKTVSFKTRDVGKDSGMNTLLIVLMIVVMIAITVIDTRRQMKKQMEEKGKVDKVDVYKEARKTGKSVEEVVAKTEKKKEKVQQKYKASQVKRYPGKNQPKQEEPPREGVKRVSAKRPISSIGKTMPATVKAEREAAAKAKAEAAARERARKEAQKAAANKKKGSKQQQKKKK